MNCLLVMCGWCWLITVRRTKYLNNIVEQDHRFIKKITRPMPPFKQIVQVRLRDACGHWSRTYDPQESVWYAWAIWLRAICGSRWITVSDRAHAFDVWGTLRHYPWQDLSTPSLVLLLRYNKIVLIIMIKYINKAHTRTVKYFYIL